MQRLSQQPVVGRALIFEYIAGSGWFQCVELDRRSSLCVKLKSAYHPILKKIKNDIKYSMWFSNSITGMNLCPFLHVHIYPALCTRCK